jgi:hypothetical protein
MTHSTVSSRRESGGSTDRVFHTVDITSLDSAGAENYTPEDAVGVDPEQHGVDVVGQADTSYLVRWDHVNEQLSVVNVADGTDVASGTAVGEVRLRVEGK